ncbi:acyltransferase [Pseudomonadales bacterium]|nr:acyltransferase [Pseudomonadales bacterium]
MLTAVSLLRGVAVVLVLFFHIDYLNFDYGYLGVDIFLTISGFLISLSVFNKYTSDDNAYRFFLDFITSRVKRIYPAVFFGVLLTLFLAILFEPYTLLLEYLEHAMYVLLSIFNMFIYGNVDYNNEMFTGTPFLHFWSLSAEVQLYLCFAGLFLVFNLLKVNLFSQRNALPIVLLSFLGSLYLSIEYGSKLYYLAPVRAFQFFAGLLLLLSFKEIISNKTFYLCVIFLSICNLTISHDFKLNYGASLAALLILHYGIRYSITANNNFFLNALKHVGDYSLSYYIVHFPIIFYADHLINGLTSVTAILLAVSLIGYISSRYFEDKFKYKFHAYVVLICMVTATSIFKIEANEVLYEDNYFAPLKITSSQFEDVNDPPFLEKCRESHSNKLPDYCKVLGTGDRKIAFLGDSHAFQMSFNVDKKYYSIFHTLSYAGCPPISNFYRPDAKYLNCDEVLERWKRHIVVNKIDTIFIFARWPYYTGYGVSEIDGAKADLDSPTYQNLFLESFGWLKEVGLERVFIVGATFEIENTIYDALVKSFHLESSGQTSRSNAIAIRNFDYNQLNNLLKTAAANNGFSFLDNPNDACAYSLNQCMSKYGGEYTYRDTNHVSKSYGSHLANSLLSKVTQ